MNEFNGIATYYDTLAKLVFNKYIILAQQHFLASVPKGANVLILGGGTGWIAKELLQLNPSCSIMYVESSSRMIELTTNSLSALERMRVKFIHSDKVPTEITVDAVITNFYLDLFSTKSLYGIIEAIEKIIKKDGLWICTDFYNEHKWWQTIFLKVMYSFFNQTCRIEASSLPPWLELLQGSLNCKKRNSLRAVDDKSFYNGFIRTVLLKKLVDC